jgi:hypothetical protein
MDPNTNEEEVMFEVFKRRLENFEYIHTLIVAHLGDMHVGNVRTIVGSDVVSGGYSPITCGEYRLALWIDDTTGAGPGRAGLQFITTGVGVQLNVIVIVKLEETWQIVIQGNRPCGQEFNNLFGLMRDEGAETFHLALVRKFSETYRERIDQIVNAR